MPDLVKLRVKFKSAEDLPSTEALWAEPVDVADGSYRLQNSSFMVPLAAGDVVRAEWAGDGELQVTGLVAASASILTIVGAPPGADLDLEPTVEAWSSQGALWTEGNAGMLVTTWSPDLRLDMIETVIRPSLGAGLQWLATALPSMRDVEHMPEVDFELQLVVVEPVEE